jgi:sodium/bile acid cotransporter 7
VRALRLDPFVAALLAAALVASFVPVTGSLYDVLLWVTRVLIALVFFLYGVRLSTTETVRGLSDWRLQSAVLVTTFVAFPLAGLGLSHLALLAPVAAGILFLCLVPSTMQTNIVLTRIAGGDTAGAVVAASLSNVIGVFLTPALVALLMSAQARVDGGAMWRVLLQLLAPFLLGQALRPWLNRPVTRHDPWLKYVDRSGVVLVVFMAFSAAASSGLWAETTPWAVLGLVALCVALLAGATAWSWLLGRLLGLARPGRIALLFCGSNKSLATGLPMASVLFTGEKVALLVLPLMIYHQLQIVLGGVIASRLARGSGVPASEEQ